MAGLQGPLLGVRDGSAVSEAKRATIQIVEMDDIFGETNDGRPPPNMSDGAGRSSFDLMSRIPSIESGRRLDVTCDDGAANDEDPDERPAALEVQAHLYYGGSVAKGMWVLDSRLPARTLVVGKQKQRKVEGYVHVCLSTDPAAITPMKFATLSAAPCRC